MSYAPAIIAAAGKVASGLFGASSARRAATKAWERTVKAYKHRYQWQMKDMRKAGLNPILSADIGAAGVGSAGIADTSAIKQLGDAPAAALDAMQKKATIAATSAQAAKTNQDAIAAEKDNKYRDKNNSAKSAILEANEDVAERERQSKESYVRKQLGIEDNVTKPVLTAQDQATASGSSAKSAEALERQVKAALIKAGMPRAEFEGKGGKYLIDAIMTLINRGRR